VRGQIVHHHDVIRPEGRHQDLLDISEEQLTVDRAIEHCRRDQTIFS